MALPNQLRKPNAAQRWVLTEKDVAQLVPVITDPQGATHFETNQADFCRELQNHGMNC